MNKIDKKEKHCLKIANNILKDISEIESLKSRVAELELFCILYLGRGHNYLTLESLDIKAAQLLKHNAPNPNKPNKPIK